MARTQWLDAGRRAEAAQRNINQLRKELYARYPQYKALTGAAPPDFAHLRALSQQNSNTIYLEYAITDDHAVSVFVLSKGRLITRKLVIAGKPLPEQIAAWLQTIHAMEICVNPMVDSSKKEDAKKIADKEPETAFALSRQLLIPLEAAGMLSRTSVATQQPTHLVIATDGLLSKLSWAALMLKNRERLNDHFAISITPSLGLLQWPVNTKRPDVSLLCIADPANSAGQVASTRFGSNLRPLPNARKEGENLRRIFPNALLYTGVQARKQTILANMPRAACLHFATHAFADARDGLHSALIVAPDAANATNCDSLEAREIADMSLSARMAVLSACETGLGQKGGGEGMLGLAWAFRAAGCPSVVASQWKADDAVTAELMTDFYKELKNGKAKDEALQKAMQKARKTNAHPYYWAAFQVIGDAFPMRFDP